LEDIRHRGNGRKAGDDVIAFVIFLKMLKGVSN
jgi:hypothetical protein